MIAVVKLKITDIQLRLDSLQEPKNFINASRSDCLKLKLQNTQTLALIGPIPVLILFFSFLYIEGGKIVTGPADLLIPLSPGWQNIVSYLSPVKYSNFGSFGNAPWGFLQLYGLSIIIGSMGIVQHLTGLIPILISYFTFWLFLGQISKNSLNRIVFSNLYVFNAVALNQFTGATGLMYIYAFIPFFLYYSMRYLHSEGRFLTNLTGSVFAIFMATFFSTETIFHVIITVIPVGLIAIIGMKRGKRSAIHGMKVIIFLVISVAISSLLLSYTYYPWFEATFGIVSPASTPLLSLKNAFLNSNFYATYPGISVFPNPIYPFFSYAFVYTPAIYALVAASISSLLIFSSFYSRDRLSNSVPAFMFVLAVTAFIALGNYYPQIAFGIFLRLKPASIPLSGFNFDQEWWYALIPWEIVLLFTGANNLPHMFERTSHLFKGYKRSLKTLMHSSQGNSVHIVERYERIGKVVSVSIVIMIILISLYTQMPTDLSQTSMNAPTQTYSYFGTVSTPNHIPTYFQQLQNSLEEKESHGLFYTLVFPGSPSVVTWTYSNPYYISFPSASGEVNNYLWRFLNATSSGNGNSAAHFLSSLGIQYVVLLWDLNETQANPTLIAQGPIGNPHVMFNSLNSSNSFSLIESNSNFSLFENREFSFVHYYPALYVLPSQQVLGRISTVNVPSMSNITLPEQVKHTNLLSFVDRKANQTEWTPIDSGKLSVSGNLSEGNVSLSMNDRGFAISYSLVGGNSNIIPVIHGQEYKVSFTAITGKNTSGNLYVGWENLSGGYVDLGVDNIPLISLSGNAEYNYSQNIYVQNESYIIPLIAVYNFAGTVDINNLTLSLVGENNVSTNISTYVFGSSNLTFVQSYNMICENNFAKGFAFTDAASENGNTGVPSVNLYYPGGDPHNPSTRYGTILPLQFYSVPQYGSIQYGKYLVSMNPASSIRGNISLSPGIYDAIIPLSGNGAFSVNFNNASTIVSLITYSFLNIPVTVENGTLSYSFTNYAGESEIGPILLFNDSTYNYVSSLLNMSEPYVGATFTENGGIFALNVTLRHPGLLEISQNFLPGWNLSLSFNGGLRVEHPAIMVIDGWETGFYVNSYGNISVRGVYEAGTIFYVTQYIQTTSLVVLPLLLLMLYIFDYKKKKMRFR